MALIHSPKITMDGLVLYLDAANPKSYGGAGFFYNLINSWIDYNNSQTHYTIIGTTYDNQSILIKNTTTNWIGYFPATTVTTGDYTLEFTYYSDTSTTNFVLDNDGLMDNAYNQSYTATTIPQKARVTITNSTTGNISFYFRRTAGNSVYITNVNYYKTNNWYDLSGYNNTGIINSGEFVSDGYLRNYGNASNFFYISVPGSTSINSTFSQTTGGWSIEELIWTNSVVYPEADGGTVASDAAYASGNTGFDWNHGIGNSQFSFGQSSNSSGPYEDQVTFSISAPYNNLNEWRLRTMLWNRTTNTVSLYINGVYQGGGSTTNTAGTAIYDGGGISFGTLYSWKHFGRRAIIRAYSKILSEVEIVQNYNATKARYV